jgi:hypothetical protein
MRPDVNSWSQPGKDEQAYKIMLWNANKKVNSGSSLTQMRYTDIKKMLTSFLFSKPA